MEWKEYSINEISKVLSSGGDAAKYQHIESPEEGYNIPIYGNSLNNDGLYGFTNVGEIYDDAVCIAARGAGTGHVFFHKGPFVPIVRLISIVPVEKMAHTRFLYYYLSNKNISGDGSAIPQITLPMIKKMKVSLPPLYEQERISSILSSLDDKIAVNRRICENLEAQAQALFKNWFVDFAPFKNGKFVESELGMIPEGWRVGTLGDLTIEVKKKVGSSNAKVLSPINTGKLVLSDDFFSKQVYSKSISKYIVVEPNDFAYNPARVNIGSIGRNEFDFIGCVSPVYVVFHCYEHYHYFIDFFRKTQYFKKNVEKLAIGGVRQTLRYEDMARIPMVIPPVEIVVSYNDIYESMYVTLKQLHSENLRLASLRDTLLPKLMSGEIKI